MRRLKFESRLFGLLRHGLAALGKRRSRLLGADKRIFRPVCIAQRLAQCRLAARLFCGQPTGLILRRTDLRGQAFKLCRLVRNLGLRKRQRLIQCRNPVRAFQLFGGRRAIILGDKAIPTTQLAVAGHQPLTNSEKGTIVSIDDPHHCKAQRQFGRCFHHIGQTLARHLRRGCGKALPPPPCIAAYRCIQIIAQCRSQRTFIAGLDLDPVNRTARTAFLDGAFQRIAFADQRGQFGLGTGKGTLRRIALSNQCRPLGFGRFDGASLYSNGRLQPLRLGTGDLAGGGKLCLIAQRFTLSIDPGVFSFRTLDPRPGAGKCGLGYAQFGLGAGLFSTRLGKLHLSLADGALAIVQCA